VHCGFCLQACPTYVVLEDENDSPRGRLVLMRSLLEGSLQTSDETVRGHLDRCLGCRACETACPAGVPYGHLLEATRATLTERHPLPLAARLMLAVFARPRLSALAMLLGRLMRATHLAPLLARLVPGRFGFALLMLEATRIPIGRKSYVPVAASDGATFALLQGCVMDGLYRDTNRATERTLTVNGYRGIAAPGQRCCGALHAHAGDLDTARRLARKNVEAFERSGATYVVSNAAGCGAMMREYGQLLAGDAAWRTAPRASRHAYATTASCWPKPGPPKVES